VDVAFRADAEGSRRVERGCGHQTAAMPTSEWKAATSCGIDVIGDRARDNRADAAADARGRG
jgi:hypothetical protein